jgi:hypothetical protein
MRLTGVRIHHALQPQPARLTLAWERAPMSDRWASLRAWAGRARWREPNERTLTIAAIGAVLVLIAAVMMSR